MRRRPTLLCTVRGCATPLVREASRVVCPNSHSFDVSRAGYINLLQPQDRRSKFPGDSETAVAARRRWHDSGVTADLLTGIAAILKLNEEDTLLDAGAGEGFYLGSLVHGTSSGSPVRTACGIDISIPAILAAARRYPACEWIVANADRLVPYADASFSKVLSITGRMNPAEFHRVILPYGRLLIALAAPDDLLELRGVGRDRVATTVGVFNPHFQILEQCRVTTRAEMTADALQDILHSIYRPLNTGSLRAMSVTFSLDLLLFAPRSVVSHHQR